VAGPGSRSDALPASCVSPSRVTGGPRARAVGLADRQTGDLLVDRRSEIVAASEYRGGADSSTGIESMERPDAGPRSARSGRPRPPRDPDAHAVEPAPRASLRRGPIEALRARNQGNVAWNASAAAWTFTQKPRRQDAEDHRGRAEPRSPRRRPSDAELRPRASRNRVIKSASERRPTAPHFEQASPAPCQRQPTSCSSSHSAPPAVNGSVHAMRGRAAEPSRFLGNRPEFKQSRRRMRLGGRAGSALAFELPPRARAQDHSADPPPRSFRGGMIALSVMWMCSGQTSVQHLVMLQRPRPELVAHEVDPVRHHRADASPSPRDADEEAGPAELLGLLVIAEDVADVSGRGSTRCTSGNSWTRSASSWEKKPVGALLRLEGGDLLVEPRSFQETSQTRSLMTGKGLHRPDGGWAGQSDTCRSDPCTSGGAFAVDLTAARAALARLCKFHRQARSGACKACTL